MAKMNCFMNSKLKNNLNQPEDEEEFIDFLQQKIAASEVESSSVYKENQSLGTHLNHLESSNSDLESQANILQNSIKKLQDELISLEEQKKGAKTITKKAKRSSSEMSIYIDSKDNTKQKCFNQFQKEVNNSLQNTISNLQGLFQDFNENLVEIRNSTLGRKYKLK